ncbi:DUF3368 domain-containing protein [Cyanothece sp. BG0011]|uniref:DUF3368 domain-containing protein n=1 Tax=Cyanothece sp. BG0011 TaxID=2082950 RepID=UPI001E2C183D|nr:DUF3368 domain-containing protein [Cyanothece sp. BG0011]
MNPHPAINTSPLIFLSKAGYLDLLKTLSSTIIVPQAVATEIQAYGQNDLTYQQLNQQNWLEIRSISSVPSIIQNWDLGSGESEVLAWGYLNKGTEIILDDLAARKCAITLKIPMRGTLGIVLLAKKKRSDFQSTSCN